MEIKPHKTVLSRSTRSKESFEQIDSWVTNCLENHEACKNVVPQTRFTPTRLIEIVAVNDDGFKIRLRKASSLNASVKYATLSHCWGSSMPFKLTKENLTLCMQEIPFEKLSKVFKDAIFVASQCGISYIWIDSICESKMLSGCFRT